VKLIYASLLILTGCPCLANAEIIYVPSEEQTIQGAIYVASAGDTILIADGTYTGDYNRDIDFMGKELTITSASGDPELCIVDCQGSVSDQHRGFVFQSGESNAACLTGITIINGYAPHNAATPEPSGGGILCSDSSPTLDNLILRDNSSSAGGGIGVWNFSGAITNCQFFNNDTDNGFCGGGLYCGSSSISIRDCLFSGNSSLTEGGGVGIGYSDVVSVESCEFYNNFSAYFGGGAIGAWSGGMGHITISYCTIARNQTGPNSGGTGIYASNCGEVIIDHCTIVDNEGGSGIWAQYYHAYPITVTNSIIAYNTLNAFSCSGSDLDISIYCTDIYGNEDGDWVGCIADLYSATGNISEDPLFCGEANPLSPYSLYESSPCSPSNYPCAQIGSQSIGCDLSDVVENETRDIDRIQCKIHPNPSNNSSNLSYTLTELQPVSIRVVDVSGRLVRALKSSLTEERGEYAVSWDGTDMTGLLQPSGIYFFQIQCGSLSDTKRIVLLNESR
jgi:Right handed beta helix region/Secretion system C-terminal sorting domain